MKANIRDGEEAPWEVVLSFSDHDKAVATLRAVVHHDALVAVAAGLVRAFQDNPCLSPDLEPLVALASRVLSDVGRDAARSDP